MRAARSRPALFLAIAIAALMAAALTAYAATARTDTGPQAVAIQPTGMSVPF
ncbi:hypothetical protein ACFPOA_10365 [Lysobacter niabensis]|uniref:hypothetical protein n=1 Tax=Agrilutibacter niabensis TaxID=380628 RepID=UPI003615830E